MMGLLAVVCAASPTANVAPANAQPGVIMAQLAELSVAAASEPTCSPACRAVMAVCTPLVVLMMATSAAPLHADVVEQRDPIRALTASLKDFEIAKGVLMPCEDENDPGSEREKKHLSPDDC